MFFELAITISIFLVGFSSQNAISPAVTLKSTNDNSQLSQNEDTLIFAQVIFRHGARNIASPYPNDNYKDEDVYWPEGFGQLTNEGKRQLWKLGLYFAARYRSILGTKYSYKKVYIQSTDVDRTIASALANLAGLFYPTEDEKWNDEILWNPVPVHTVPSKQDYVLAAAKECPKYKDTFDRYMKESEEVQRIYTEYADLFPYLAQHSGLNITTITDVYWLYNTLEIERDTNKILPDWAKKVMKPNGTMEYIATYDYKTYADTPQLARLKSGFLLKEILEHFTQKVNATLQPDRTLWLYSGHDITILNMLNSLGLFELHISPYAASLHFELYKNAQNEHYIQLFYRRYEEEHPLPMVIPGCSEKCPLDHFYALYRDIIPGDFDVECRLS